MSIRRGVSCGDILRENGHERMKRDLCDQLDQYAPVFREAEHSGNGLAIGYDLEQILADEGGPLGIPERSFI